MSIKPTIFISSSDSYLDIWPVFFDLFKKYWPEYSGIIYLNTEEKTYKTEGLNIKCTQVGKLGSFGKVLRAGLDKVDEDNLLLIMIDYIFMGKVNNERIEAYYHFFLKSNLDSLCLTYQSYPNQLNTDNDEIKLVTPYSDNGMFSYQAAFWKKEMLYKMALPHENPWTSEWFGTLRAYKMKLKLGCISNISLNPIPYDLAGCLHKGKWLENAILFLNDLNFDINFNVRGYYKEVTPTLKDRIKSKWMIVKHGLRGSYWYYLFCINKK